MADAYRDPDLRERVRELEAELNELREENAAFRKKRRWAWLGAAGRGIAAAWLWFWRVPAFPLFIISVVGLFWYAIHKATRPEEPKAERTVDLNGRPSFVIKCGGTDCMLLAGRSCPHGYEVTKEMPDGLLIVCKEEKK